MTLTGLPRWDLTSIFPSLDSPAFRQAFDEVVGGIAELAALCDRHDVRKRPTREVDAATAAAFDEIVARLNALLEKQRTVGAYIYCHVTTDAANEAAQAALSSLQAQGVRLRQIQARLTAWIGSMDAEALLRRSATAREHEFMVRKAALEAAHQMSEAEESLAAELSPSARDGWARLHGQMTALLTAQVELEGKVRTLPMSAVRSLATHPDRDVRRRAYEAELKAWETIAIPMAAAMNGIKGCQGVLRARRRYSDDVEPTLFHNNIDAATLAAMQEACEESFPDFRRYLRAKAKALGLERLAWYDLDAPLGASARRWSWQEAEEFVIANFGEYSDRLRAFAERAFGERWVDAEPRVGKEGGAYCTGIRGGESRVMMNFDGSFGSRFHPCSRAGTRLPQPEPGRTDAAPADGPQHPGRDRQHLLRDPGLRGGPAARRRRREARPPLHQPAEGSPGGRGHPQPVPL